MYWSRHVGRRVVTNDQRHDHCCSFGAPSMTFYDSGMAPALFLFLQRAELLPPVGYQYLWGL